MPLMRVACALSSSCCGALGRRSHSRSDPSSAALSSTRSSRCSVASTRRSWLSTAVTPPSPLVLWQVTCAPHTSENACAQAGRGGMGREVVGGGAPGASAGSMQSGSARRAGRRPGPGQHGVRGARPWAAAATHVSRGAEVHEVRLLLQAAGVLAAPLDQVPQPHGSVPVCGRQGGGAAACRPARPAAAAAAGGRPGSSSSPGLVAPNRAHLPTPRPPLHCISPALPAHPTTHHPPSPPAAPPPAPAPAHPHLATDSASLPEGCTARLLTAPLWPRMTLRCCHSPPACHTQMAPSLLPLNMWLACNAPGGVYSSRHGTGPSQGFIRKPRSLSLCAAGQEGGGGAQWGSGSAGGGGQALAAGPAAALAALVWPLQRPCALRWPACFGVLGGGGSVKPASQCRRRTLTS
jgi:hypothetical protein